jgi:hypothetical protein
MQRQVRFQGWGVSLAWWAERVGTWSKPSQAAIVALVFGDPRYPSGKIMKGDPVYPLGVNIVRYNIGASGAGDRCSHEGFRPGGEVPTLVEQVPRSAPTTANPALLSRDPAQVGILKQANTVIVARKGVTPYLEAFANSPPWWLLRTGCPRGDHMRTVLRDSNDALAYGLYLAEVVKAFRHAGIRFSSVDPLNEPDGDWSAEGGNGQEGAYFSDDKASSSPLQRSARSDVVQDACRYLTPLGVPVSADDGQSSDLTLGFVKHDLIDGCPRQINTHTYGPKEQREELARAVRASGRSLWMSEYGNPPSCDERKDPKNKCDPECATPNPPSQNAICVATKLAAHIADDLNGLAPNAWIYWTAMEGTAGQMGWGLLTNGNYPTEGMLGSDVTLSMRFWALGQYARFIPSGSTIIPVSSTAAGGVRIVVAKTRAHGVVVVATNPASDGEPLRIDLSPLGVHNAKITAYRTTTNDHEMQLAAPTASLKSDALTAELPGQSITTYLLGAAAATAPPKPDRFAVDAHGRVGPLVLNLSQANDVIAVDGRPEVTYEGNVGVPELYPEFRALGYDCAGVGTPRRDATCRTIFFVNKRTSLLTSFTTFDRRYHTTNGTSPGTAQATADRLEHQTAQDGCINGIAEHTRHATLMLDNVGGHLRGPSPNAQGASQIRITGGKILDMSLEANSGSVGIQFC